MARYPFERPLGATPPATAGRVPRLGARAPTRRGPRPRRGAPAGPAGMGVREARVEAAHGDDYVFVLDGTRAARSGLALAARGPARPVARRRPARASRGPTGLAHAAPLEDVGHLRAARRHVHRGGHVRRRDRAPARPARSWASPRSRSCPSPSSRAAAAGATTASTSRAAQSSYGGPEGLAAPRRRRPRGRPRGRSSTSSTTTSARPATRRSRRSAPTSPTSTRRSGARRSTTTTRDCDPVREWVLQSAEGWVRDFHVDGLRLDAIHAIYDQGARHIMAALAERVHAQRLARSSSPRAGMNDPKVMRPRERGGFGHDAAWADDFHHALRTLLTGDREGYYEEFGRVAAPRQGLPPPVRPRRPVLDVPPPALRRARRRPPARAVRRLRPEPRPGRQPRARRPPAGRGAAARRVLHAAVAVHADAVHGRGVRRARAVPVLHRPHRRGDRGRHARGPPARVRRRSPRSPARRSPTRRTRRRSSAPSSRRDGDPALRELYGACSRSRRDAAARRRRRARSTSARAGCASTAARTRLCCNFAARGRSRARAGRGGGRARHPRGAPRRRRRAPARAGRGAAAMSRKRWPGRPFPLGPTWDGRGHELLAVLRERRRASSCACSTTTATRSASSSPSAPRTTGTATCPASAPASATATASTAPTSPRTGHRFNPAKLLIDPYAKAIEGAVQLGRGERRCPTSPTRSDTADLEPDDEDDAEAIPKCVVDRRRASTGRATRRPTRRGTRRSSTRRTSRASRSATPTVREDLRGTYGGLASEPAVELPQGARRHRGRAAAGPPHRRRALPRTSRG